MLGAMPGSPEAPKTPRVRGATRRRRARCARRCSGGSWAGGEQDTGPLPRSRLAAPQRAPLVLEPPQSRGTRGLRGRGGGPIPILVRPRPVPQPWQRAAGVTHELRLCRRSHSSRCCFSSSPPCLLGRVGKNTFWTFCFVAAPAPPPPLCPHMPGRASPGGSRHGTAGTWLAPGCRDDVPPLGHHASPPLGVFFFPLKGSRGFWGPPRQSPRSGAGGAGGHGAASGGGTWVWVGGSQRWCQPWGLDPSVATWRTSGEPRGGWGGTDLP